MRQINEEWKQAFALAVDDRSSYRVDELTGFSHVQVRHWLRGNPPKDAETVRQLADGLEFSRTELLRAAGFLIRREDVETDVSESRRGFRTNGGSGVIIEGEILSLDFLGIVESILPDRPLLPLRADRSYRFTANGRHAPLKSNTTYLIEKHSTHTPEEWCIFPGIDQKPAVAHYSDLPEGTDSERVGTIVGRVEPQVP